VSSTGRATSQALRRFSTFVILCTIAGAAAAAVLSFRSTPTYSGQGLYLVPPGGSTGAGVLTPFDAERIARTYAVVLAEDEQVLEELGSSLDLPATELADRVQAVILPNSSAVRVTYSGDSRAEVREYFEALTDLVEASDPPTPNLRPGTLRLLQSPDDVVRSGGGSWAAPLAGALAGLLLGLAAATLLTRADPRVQDADDLREPGGPSVVEVDPADEPTVEALAIRALEAVPDGAWVAVVSTTEAARGAADDLTGRLGRATQALTREGALPARLAGTGWVPASLGSGRGERAAQDADRTVLVVPEGTPLRAVAGRLADLRDLGVADVVLCLLRPAARAARSARSAPPAPPAPALETLEPAGPASP
jgi:capsular polysaccharide biosynthesis protein